MTPRPPYQIPPNATRVAISSEMVREFVTVPSFPPAVGKVFCMGTGDEEMYYHVDGFEASYDGKLKFQVRLDDIEYAVGNCPS